MDRSIRYDFLSHPISLLINEWHAVKERARQQQKEAATVRVCECKTGEVDNPEQSVECGRPSRGDQRRGGV